MSTFNFKYFSVQQSHAVMRVSTDAMILGACMNANGKKHGLDIGTGTGVLSLMAAQKNPNITITAVEIDAGSVRDCVSNFSQSPWEGRLNVVEQDIRQFDPTEKFDLIFSNPPFYRSTRISEVPRLAQAKHAGFLPVEVLLPKVRSLLLPEGDFWVIVPAEDAQHWEHSAKYVGLHRTHRVEVSGSPNRSPNRTVLCLSTLKPQNYSSQRLLIRDEFGAYTEAYKELTKNYHGVEL